MAEFRKKFKNDKHPFIIDDDDGYVGFSFHYEAFFSKKNHQKYISQNHFATTTKTKITKFEYRKNFPIWSDHHHYE